MELSYKVRKPVGSGSGDLGKSSVSLVRLLILELKWKGNSDVIIIFY